MTTGPSPIEDKEATRTWRVVFGGAPLPQPMLEGFSYSVNRAVEQISAFVGAMPPPLIRIRVTTRGPMPATRHAAAVILIPRARFPERTAVIHELTHLIAGRPAEEGEILEEGLAVLLQARLSGPHDRSYPSEGLDVDSALISQIKTVGRTIPLREVSAIRVRRSGGEERKLAYLEQGAFAGFILAEYGLGQFNDIYRGKGSYERVIGKPLASLEQEWLSFLRPKLGETADTEIAEHGDPTPWRPHHDDP